MMQDNPFAPKLTFDKQCAIYAFHHQQGKSYVILGIAFNIHPRTVRAICFTNKVQALQQYKRVHKEAHRLGVQGMWNTYVTNEMQQQVAQATEHYRNAEPPSSPPLEAQNVGGYDSVSDVPFGVIIEARGGVLNTLADVAEHCELQANAGNEHAGAMTRVAKLLRLIVEGEDALTSNTSPVS